jgi:hypothetical protein
MRPLKPRMGRPMTILVAVLIWVVAMLIAVPQLLYFTTEYNPGADFTYKVISSRYLPTWRILSIPILSVN